MTRFLSTGGLIVYENPFDLEIPDCNIGEIADFGFNFLAGVRSGIGFYTNYKTWRIGFELSNGNMRYVGIFDNTGYGLNTGRFDISLGFKF